MAVTCVSTAASVTTSASAIPWLDFPVNRVVLLSDGEYNVHMTGVNWAYPIHARGQSRELLCDCCASPSSRSGRTCPGRTPWLLCVGCREGERPTWRLRDRLAVEEPAAELAA